jgi:isopenicillin-N N-acyltransferase-like protein
MHFITFALWLLLPFTAIHANALQTSGQGYLEVVDGQQILHLIGSPYEIGYQHGVLLKDQIAHNAARFIDKNLPPNPTPSAFKYFLKALPQILPHIPSSLIEEMHGVADGSGIPYDKILLMNLFPEMFHCSAIAVKGQATQNGELYHVRVLDYAAAAMIQDTAVLFAVKPANGNAFANVTYAGFIGSVTGLNEQKIGLGEIGGKGYGSWNGMPMAFLLRHILQHASSINDIKKILETTPRTCEYYYVFSDGKTGDMLGVYSTSEHLQYIEPGTQYALPIGTYQQPADSIVLTRNQRYTTLIERLMLSYGKIDVLNLQAAIQEPVADCSNLHNAIFAPQSMEMWISHAGPNGEPAYSQPYHYYDVERLLHQP